MNFDYSDTQTMLIDSVDRLMRDHSGVEQWRARRDLTDGVNAALWRTFAELGWLALPIPEDAGGLGGSMEDVALLMIALGKELAIEPIVSTAVLGAHIIDRAAAGSEREAMLRAISSGELKLALAHDEASDRYELTSRRATIARSDGGAFILSGAKMLVLDAPSADLLLVTASIEGEPGFAIFLVDHAAAGLKLSPYPLIDASRAADIDLVDVRVPVKALLASGEAAVALLTEAVDRARIALIAQAIGSMEASIVLCGDYAKERRQFGQPIGKFQAIQHLAADMFVASFQARSALYQALAHVHDEPGRRAHAISIAKVMVSEAGQTVGRNGIQIHGGYGVTDEYAISHHYRRLLVIEKHFGDIEHHLAQIAGAENHAMELRA